MSNTWRAQAALVIHPIIAATGTNDMPLLKRRLFEAYPFGQRKYYPYKIWCEEIRRQLGIMPYKRKSGHADPVPPEQGHLW